MGGNGELNEQEFILWFKWWFLQRHIATILNDLFVSDNDFLIFHVRTSDSSGSKQPIVQNHYPLAIQIQFGEF